MSATAAVAGNVGNNVVVADGSPCVKPESAECGAGEGNRDTMPQHTPDGKKRRRRGKRGKGNKKSPTAEVGHNGILLGHDASTPTQSDQPLAEHILEGRMHTPKQMSQSSDSNELGNTSVQKNSAGNAGKVGEEAVNTEGAKKQRKPRHRNRRKSSPTNQTEVDDSKLSSSQSKSGVVQSKPDVLHAPFTPPSVRHEDQQSPRTSRTPTHSERRPNSPHTPQSGNRGNRDRNRGTPRTPHGGRNVGGTPGRQNFKPFEDYWTLEDVSHGLKRNELHRGILRINPKNFEEAYLDNPIGGADFMISGVTARNRSLPGDIVVVQVLPKKEWKVMENDYDIYLAKQKSLPKKTSKQPTSDTKNDITSQLSKLNINSTSASQTRSEPSEDNLKQGLRQNHEQELEDMQKIVKKLFADDLLGTEGPAAQSDIGTQVEGSGNAQEEIPDEFYQRMAKVVYIIEKRHSRACTGYLKKPQSQRATDAMFSPVDCRLPRIHIPLTECPEAFHKRPQDFANTLFIARIDDWPQHSAFAKGHLHRSLGEAGEIEPETEGMLIEHDIDYSEFKQEVLDCLPTNLPWQIPTEELRKRRDLRKECIFTIDPATARDLDDALHCKALGNNEYELGVHIADVSYFVDEGTALDNSAAMRATSVYLVHKVIPMLPRLLCEQLCSLNPDEDRLTFSIIWKMTEEGEILDEWCGRTIIRSCVKMSYDHAQDIIENPKKQFLADDLPPITNGFGIPMIVEGVANLNKIAVKLRKKRFDEGALRLDQIKLQYTLNSDTGMPSGYWVYQQRDSNKLVEEFMLLANMAVAHRIYKKFATTALLRRHPPPKSKMMDDLIDKCYEMGIDIEGSSSSELQKSLKKYMGEDNYSRGMSQILTVLYSKPMQRALYFCTGSIPDEEIYRHYALNVPVYTHFTSPIRRYPDIIVHRLLAASLGYIPEPQRDSASTEEQASHCNVKKDKAKRASELSSEMFFSIFVKECGPLEEEGMVMAVLDHSIDVLVLKLGVTKRVYCNNLPLRSFRISKKRRLTELILVWAADDSHPEATQTIKMFTVVSVILEASKERLKYNAIIKRPEESEEK